MFDVGTLNKVNLRCLPPLFRMPFLRKVKEGMHLRHLFDVMKALGADLDDLKSIPLLRLMVDFYSALQNHYRCEYVYKNVLAQEMFLKLHPAQDAYLCSELRSGSSRADLAIFNGTSTVYEVKSEFDSIEKLPGQIFDYQRIFEFVCLVVAPSMEAKVTSLVDSRVGIYVLDENTNLELFRRPSSGMDLLSHQGIFETLRHNECASILTEAFGEVPKVPNGVRYRAYYDLFQQLPIEKAHRLAVSSIKERGVKQVGILNTIDIPECLTHIYLTANIGLSSMVEVHEALLQPMGAEK